eukprot:jgi/Mesen1/785/ME000110S_11054
MDSGGDAGDFSMTGLLGQLRNSRDGLGPQPTLDEVVAAQTAITEINRGMIDAMEKLLVGGQKADQGEGSTLQALKEEQIRQEAASAKRRHLAVIDTDEAYRHYNGLVRQLERALVKTTVAGGGNASGSLPPVPAAPGSLPKSGSQVSASRAVAAAQQSSPSSPFPSGSLPETTMFSFSPEREDTLSYLSNLSNSSSPNVSLTAGSGSRLRPIREARKSIECPPKLLTAIEQAIANRADRFDISQTFGNNIIYLPSTLGAISTLTDLNVSSNQLDGLPDTVGQLALLTRLEASNNQLVEVPQTISKLSNLQVLNLQHNKLDEIPSAIGACQALTDLNLGFNNIRQLPETVGQLGQLRKLAVHLNQLKTLPRSLGNLENLTELDAHFNFLTSLPEGLGQLPHLRVLNCSANHYELKELPAWIGNLESLTELDISENQIRALPESFACLTNLKRLRLDGNPLRIPPMKVCQGGLEEIMAFMEGRSKEQEARSLTRRNSGSGFRSGLRSLLDASMGKKSKSAFDEQEVNPVLDKNFHVVL